ncbi:hypothetical protein [Microcoleus sp. F4-D5]|uniref:hypothetical protein n=1 Tax=Microcoleus sp. F4-D5 TaxID=2818760 RepID=UPI002FD5220C
MKIQLIAYEIDTHDPTKLNDILQAKGIQYDEMSEEDYFTCQANELKNKIQGQVVKYLNDDTLTIFMAPEFYFKYRNGLPYQRTTFFNKLEYLQAISMAFSEVMIVPGSIWWSEPTKDARKVIVHNTVPILFAGNIIHTWQKERLSRLDGLNKGPQVWDRDEEDYKRILDSSQTPFFQINFKNDPTKPILFGIEICLDHLTLDDPPNTYGVMRTKYLENYQNLNQGVGVDVHLLVAAGMPLQKENIVARNNGVLFRSDGGQGMKRSSCVKILRYGADPVQELQKWNPTLDAQTPGYIEQDPDNRIAIYPAIQL